MSVTDEQGRPVLGLEASDFDVREAGRRRSVRSVSFWSASSGALVDDRVDGVAPTRPAGGPMTDQHAERGRLIVLLLDDMLTSPRRTHAVRRAVDEFVTRHVRADDQVAVITTSGRLDIDSGFLTDRRTMLARTGRFAGTATEAMTGGFVAALSVRRTMEIVGSLARMSPRTGGRPLNVVPFSEGVEFDIYNQRDMNTSDVNQAMRQAVDRIRASNLVLYAVDPRGLVTLEDGRTERNTYARRATSGQASPRRCVRRPLRVRCRAFVTSPKRREVSRQRIATTSSTPSPVCSGKRARCTSRRSNPSCVNAAATRRLMFGRGEEASVSPPGSV